MFRFPIVDAAAAVAFLLAALLPASQPAEAASPHDWLSPCHVDGMAEEVLCGIWTVPEDAADSASRSLDLDVVVVPAQAPIAADPIFVLAGGPGQAATEFVGFSARALEPARLRHDLVFIDQRGTGGEHALDCEAGSELALFAESVPVEAMNDCLGELTARADLRFYSTFHFARDLDAVRAALGYERVNLWGASYGTRAGLVYERLFPERVAALVLDGLAPYELTLPSHNAREAQRALDLAFAACVEDAACAAAIPDPAGDLARLLERVEAEPWRLEVDHPRTGQRIEIHLMRPAVVGSLRTLLYGAGTARQIPYLVHRAAEGDAAPLVTSGLVAASHSRDSMAFGLTFTVLCSEDVARIDPVAARAEASKTIFGTDELDAWLGVCESWPRLDLPDDFHRLEPSEAPALLLSGALDPIVPPSWGEVVAGLHPRSLHVVVPGAGHGTVARAAGCLDRLVADFLDAPDEILAASAARSDVPSCAESLSAPPLFAAVYGPEP